MNIDDLRTKAESGDAQAQFDLAEAYYRGDGVPQDYSEAVLWHHKAADQGYAFAQNRLGDFYRLGLHVPQDDAEAAKWFRLAADQGDVWAQTNLGNCYYSGKGVPQDYKEAVSWYIRAAEQGYEVPDKLRLGDCYAYGRGVALDYKEALKWYRLAVEDGKSDALFRISILYAEGKGVPQDRQESAKLFHLAAYKGCAEARYRLGKSRQNADGSPMDPEKALKWLRLAAFQGHQEARIAVINSYIRGEGIPQDHVHALAWCEFPRATGNEQVTVLRSQLLDKLTPKQIASARQIFGEKEDWKKSFPTLDELRTAAENGNATAQYEIGRLYSAGKFTPAGDLPAEPLQPCAPGCIIPDDMREAEESAFNWFLLAAEQGHPKAQLALSNCYLFGHDGKEDLQNCIKWCLRAAEQGDVDAQISLGDHYDWRVNNPVEAVKWFKMAADQGSAFAYYMLSQCHLDESDKYTSEAVALLRKSAELRSEIAQEALWRCYATGEGTEKNYAEASAWLSVYNSSKWFGAEIELMELIPKMTPEELEAGKALAEKYSKFQSLDGDM